MNITSYLRVNTCPKSTLGVFEIVGKFCVFCFNIRLFWSVITEKLLCYTTMPCLKDRGEKESLEIFLSTSLERHITDIRVQCLKSCIVLLLVENALLRN